MKFLIILVLIPFFCHAQEIKLLIVNTGIDNNYTVTIPRTVAKSSQILKQCLKCNNNDEPIALEGFGTTAEFNFFVKHWQKFLGGKSLDLQQWSPATVVQLFNHADRLVINSFTTHLKKHLKKQLLTPTELKKSTAIDYIKNLQFADKGAECSFAKELLYDNFYKLLKNPIVQKYGLLYGCITTLHFNPQAPQIATGDSDGKVTISSCTNLQDTTIFTTYQPSIHAVQYNNDGSQLAIAHHNQLVIHDSTMQQSSMNLQPSLHNEHYYRLLYHPYLPIFAALDHSRIIKFIDPNNGKSFVQLPNSWNFAFDDNSYLMAQSDIGQNYVDCSIKIMDLRKLDAKLKTTKTDAFSTSSTFWGNNLIVSDYNSVRVHNLDTIETVQPIELATFKAQISHLRVNSEHNVIAYAFQSPEYHVIQNLKNKNFLYELKKHERVLDVCWNKQNTMLAWSQGALQLLKLYPEKEMDNNSLDQNLKLLYQTEFAD